MAAHSGWGESGQQIGRVAVLVPAAGRTQNVVRFPSDQFGRLVTVVAKFPGSGTTFNLTTQYHFRSA